jgi:hypothetical protein
MFRDPLFQTTDYQAFELSVRGALAIAIEEDPHSLAIQKAVPALNDRLRTMTGVIQNGQVTHTQALSTLEGMLVSRIGQLSSAIDDFVGGSFTCQFVPQSQGQAGSRTGLAAPSSGGSVGPLAPVPLPVTGLASAAPASGLGQYSMSRAVHTIPELWQEWTIGLQGQPSIERLDELYGSRWRTGLGKASERQFYSRRKTLITEIKRLAAIQAVAAIGPSEGGGQVQARDPFHVVITQLEEERKWAGLSLSKVIDRLK